MEITDRTICVIPPATKNFKRLFWCLGVVLLGAGLVGAHDRITHGHVHANYGNVITWGLWVAAYMYFSGLSAGAFLISSLVYVFNVKQYEKIGRLALFTAVVTLVMALLSIIVDIGHMDRAWHVMVYPNFESPMAWMIWLYSGYSLVLLAELWFLLRRDFAAGKNMPGIKGKAYRLLSLGFSDVSDASAAQDRKVVRVLATIGVPVAIMFSGGVGALFGVVAAHPHWHSGMFPILFLLSGLVGGGALLTLVSTIFQDGWHRNRDTVISLGKLILGLLLLEALFQASEFLIAFRGGVPGDVAGLKLVVGGPYWWVFWLWQVLLGTLAPALLLIFPTRRNPHWVSLAGLLIAAGLFGLRLNIVIPGLAVEEIQGLSDAIASARVSAHYLPSVSEWMLTGGIVGLGLLLFGLGEKWLPMEPKEFENVRV